MIMNFHIARHYWKNAENASWQVAEDFPKDLLENFKEDYSFLESKRPEYKRYDGGTIFYYYKDAKDIYGRSITEITAAACDKRLHDPESVVKLLRKQLSHIDNENFNLVINVANASCEKEFRSGIDAKKDAATKSSKRFDCKLVLVGLFVLIAIGVSMFLRKKLMLSVKPSQPKVIATKKNSRVPNRKSHSEQNKPKLKKNKVCSKVIVAPTSENPREVFLKLYMELGKVPPYIDDKCVYYYIENQSDKNQARLSYEEWFKNIGAKTYPQKCSMGTNELRKDKKTIIELLWVENGIKEKFSERFFNGE